MATAATVAPGASSTPRAALRAPFRVLALALAVFFLVGGWVGLYLRARNVDLREQNEILGYLRELKEIDNRWNDRLIGARIADTTQADPTTSPVTPVSLSITQHKLAVRAQSLGSPALNQSLAALKESFAQKAVLVERFWAAHRQLRESLDAYNQAAVGASARAATAVARMSAALSNLLAQPAAQTQAVANAVIGELDAAGVGNAEIGRRAREIVPRKMAEESAFRAALYASTGPRIDTLTREFDREFENALQAAELYRMVLLLYSGVVLAILAFVGMRLASTYQVISKMNRALRDANEGLERRVEDRTRALSQALAQLKESEALLIQSEKMSSLGQMVAGVAHEVNTPLSYVKSSLETVSAGMPRLAHLQGESERLLGLLRDERTTPEALTAQFAAVQGLIDEMRQAHVLPDMQSLVKDGLHGIAQISELVANLRNFARLDRSRLGELDLNEGVDGALAIARNMVKHRTVRKDYGQVPRLLCSPSQVNQVLLNLITNAAQATSETGGTITLRTGMRDAQNAFFEIEDNGHGIAEDVLPKIFDPFFTTKDVGQGTGLGLSIAYKIVEQHGGKILVASKPNVGTRFVVVLPLKAAAGAGAGQPAPARTAAAGAS